MTHSDWSNLVTHTACLEVVGAKKNGRERPLACLSCARPFSTSKRLLRALLSIICTLCISVDLSPPQSLPLVIPIKISLPADVPWGSFVTHSFMKKKLKIAIIIKIITFTNNNNQNLESASFSPASLQQKEASRRISLSSY